MALILNIDTSTERASLSLSKDGTFLGLSENPEQKEHASWLHQSIKQMMDQTGYRPADLEAVAVTTGPGSFTGLRVGLSTAKGLCYALGIPLITENTLMVMAFSANYIDAMKGAFLCPMIDARRQEVFAALYRSDLQEIMAPVAIVLTPDFVGTVLAQGPVLFFGSGSKKWNPPDETYNAFFADVPYGAEFLGVIAERKFQTRDFADIFSSEPIYVKEFYTHAKK